MPGTVINGSPNITLFDSKIVADICLGKFFVDISPSVFITDNTQSPVYNGALNILGVKVQLTNPYGVIIKPYGSSYDINSPAASPIITIYERAIPTQAGTVQYGVYTIALELTDADGIKYYVTKTINVCTYNKDQNPCDDRLRLVASCKNGTLGIYLAEPPLFKGFYAQSHTQTIVVNYPTASGHAVTNSTFGNFSVQLFEGVYKVVVNVCALYNLTDNVYLKLPYVVTMEKNVKCLLDYTCIWPKIEQLWDKIDSDCSEAEKNTNASIAISATLLVDTIEFANEAGEDASPYIAKLEKLLGCVCVCDCAGSPLVNGTPSTNLAIQGCGFTKTTVGLTDVYTFDNPEFTLDEEDSTGTITVGAAEENACQKTQKVYYSASAAYTALKTQINTATQYTYWASVIKSALAGLDTACLGGTYTTFLQLMQAIINKACEGGSCTATISGNTTAVSGGNVTISWTQSGGYKTGVYVDGTLVATVLTSVSSFIVVGGADGNTHTYLLIPICTNGNHGTTVTGTYNDLGCPTVTPPVVSSNSVTDAECPYSLTSLLAALPVGITVEWHTANNTLAATLVPAPTAVSGGIYYAFAKNTDGCYSTATVVTIICESATSCTAPQSLLVTLVSGDFRVTFNSAANPPPSNSYTVKRRLSSSPDVDGSYTTIGAPVYNSGLAKWVITDTTGLDNTLYVYKAISNCGGSPATTPSTTYTFANITCPTVTLNPASDSVAYSFTGVGGEVSKYEVKIYDSTGLTLIHTDTILPAFSTPITGTLTYLTSGTTYKVMVTVFIGSYSEDCAFTDVTTDTADTISAQSYMNLASPAMSGTIVVSTIGGRTLRFANFSICGVSSASVTISGGIGVINNNITSGVPNATQYVDTLLPVGSYTYTGTLVAGCTSTASIYFI